MKEVHSHLLFAASLAASLAAATLTSCGQSFDERFAQEVARENKVHCPQRLDAQTMLDSVAYSPATRTYTRFCSLPTASFDVVIQNAATVDQSLLSDLRSDTSWNTCKEEGITFRYVYKDQQNPQRIKEFVFAKERYQ